MRRSLALVVMASMTARMVARSSSVSWPRSARRASSALPGACRGPPGRVGGDKVVDAGVEGLGDADDGFETGGDPAVFVAADLAGVAADLLGELGLGQALLGAQLAESAREERAGHVTAVSL